MHPQSLTSGQIPSRSRKRWTRRKKIAVVLVTLMVMAPFVAAGLYVWQITQAIEGVQDNSVVELPTSQTQLGGISQIDDEPDSDPAATPGNTETNATPQATEGPTRQSSSRNNPSSIGIARDLIGTGIRTDVVEPKDVWGDTEFINILVLGVDTRSEGGDHNADVIMIARVDFTTREVRVVSIPRDLQVEVPGHGLSKINGAYNIGVKENPDSEVAGVLMMRDTIEYNFGIPIDEFVMVDFQGFEEVIDAVGGITIVVPERIEDDTYPTEDFGTTTLVIEAGRQNMDGETALAYARTRHQDNDDKRRERQMQVLLALLDKGQSLGSVTRVSQVINAAGDAVLTSINWQEQLALMNVALKIDKDTIIMENITEPLVVPGTADDGGWIYVGDPVEIGDFIESVLIGSPPEG